MISAYACEPGKGSEPGVGWQTALALSRMHDVWVLTRANNQNVIETEIVSGRCGTGLNFIYHDLPAWARKLKYTLPGLHLYYYLWQLTAVRKVRAVHREIQFDIAHHLTFGRLRSPSCAAFLGIPFLFGPVGGGDYVPPGFEKELGLKGRFYEWARHVTHALAALDPVLRKTVRASSIALGTTDKAVEALQKLGASGPVDRVSEAGLTEQDFDSLSKLAALAPAAPIRFMSVGRLLGLKGFSFGLMAFAKANIPSAEYWIVGDGPDRQRLENLSVKLGISDKVKFLGWCVRDRALEYMGQCHVLVHPSLHDSGGWVCLEAMAAAKPVICLDWAGPGTQVSSETGIPVFPNNPEQTTEDIASAMQKLAENPELRQRLGANGVRHVRENFSWERRAADYGEYYRRILSFQQK